MVEDHPPTQEPACVYLTNAGYGVHIVHEIDAGAVVAAVALQPVAITLDLLLGEKDILAATAAT